MPALTPRTAIEPTTLATAEMLSAVETAVETKLASVGATVEARGLEPSGEPPDSAR